MRPKAQGSPMNQLFDASRKSFYGGSIDPNGAVGGAHSMCILYPRTSAIEWTVHCNWPRTLTNRRNRQSRKQRASIELRLEFQRLCIRLPSAGHATKAFAPRALVESAPVGSAPIRIPGSQGREQWPPECIDFRRWPELEAGIPTAAPVAI